MNRVYCAAQFTLPSARFLAVEAEQVEWLKKRDAARIKALQELVW